MLEQAAKFLIDVAFGLYAYAFLLRFAMQVMRAPYRNPLAQALTALTDWAVKPMRRVVPGARGIDWSTLLLAFAAQYLWLVAIALLLGPPWMDGSMYAMLILLAAVKLLEASLWLLIILVFAQALLSWVAPDGPLSGVLNALTFRFLAPVRRMIPPIGGTLDLSPLIVLVLANLALMLPVRWLESVVISLIRS